MQGKPSFRQKYQTLERVGSGKMGIIYKVKKRSEYLAENECQVYASKHLSLHRIDLAIAKKELNILEQLKQEYIIRYIEDFVEDNELIIIMEYCMEKDLSYHIEKMKTSKKYFNENLISTWIFQLILAIDHIHTKNIIHRDIKPQNIFLDKNMNLKIGDFGVSKLLEGSQNSKTFAGTPLYISPELSKNQKYSKKTDIWSLGCVIHQLCTLQKPFSPKQGLAHLIECIQTKQPKNIPSVYSENIKKLIKKMLTKDPKMRPSARQLLLDKILVQIMINYSSKVNLKEYEQKSVQPQVTESFIQKQSNSVNSQLKKFQDEVKKKIFSFKNKKVKVSEVDKQYAEVQKKLKQIQNVVKIAFEELRSRSEKDDQLKNTLSKSFKLDAIEESQETIQSVEFGNTKSKVEENGMGQSSIDSVQSVFITTAKNKTNKTSKSIQNPIQQSCDQTFQSQYVKTVSDNQNIGGMTSKALEKLEEIEKKIIDKPELVMDETFMNYTLSISHDLRSFKTTKKLEDTINFDFSKKQYEESFGKPISQHVVIEEDEEQEEQYQPDFQELQEDKSMDIREQQKKSVKDLFNSTLKSLNIQNDSGANSSPQGFRHKYNLTLSQIREHSNQGSIVSREDDIQ